AEWPIILTCKPILGTENYVGAQLPTVTTKIHKRDARPNAEKDIVVVGSIDQNQRAQNRRGIRLFLSFGLQTRLVAFVHHGVVQAGKRTSAVKLHDLALQLAGVDRLA